MTPADASTPTSSGSPAAGAHADELGPRSSDATSAGSSEPRVHGLQAATGSAGSSPSGVLLERPPDLRVKARRETLQAEEEPPPSPTSRAGGSPLARHRAVGRWTPSLVAPSAGLSDRNDTRLRAQGVRTQVSSGEPPTRWSPPDKAVARCSRVRTSVLLVTAAVAERTLRSGHLGAPPNAPGRPGTPQPAPTTSVDGSGWRETHPSCWEATGKGASAPDAEGDPSPGAGPGREGDRRHPQQRDGTRVHAGLAGGGPDPPRTAVRKPAGSGDAQSGR